MSAATSTGMSSWRDFAARWPADLRLVQFISDLVFGDAASTDTARWRETFAGAGIDAPIYAHHFDVHHAAICQGLDHYQPRPNDVLLFHYTTWTPAAEYVLRLGRPVVLMYHNVTPPEFFAGLDATAEAATRRGRDELATFVPITPIAIAKSEFSRTDLVAAGFPRTATVPVRVDFELLEGGYDASLLRTIRSGPPSVLTMGRVVPNKCIEDVICSFAYYRRGEPEAHLYCVGAHDEHGPYVAYLRWLIARLGLRNSVTITGQVPHEQRGAYYRGCRAYLTMSEHEGFCVPLVEAMHLGQPTIGYAAAAVPETMGDAGVLVRTKRHDLIGEALGLLVEDGPLRTRTIAKGREQARGYRAEVVEVHLAALLGEALRA